MKRILRLVALVGSTVFGVACITQIAGLIYIYITTYRLPAPPFPIPSYHRFPIYRVNRDLMYVAPTLFAFVCFVVLYRYVVRAEREIPK